jgi:Flp pilus assembly pilin Flp
MELILKFSVDEAGASAVEYAFLLTFITFAIAGSVLTLGNNIRVIFENAAALFPSG